jgi:RNA polymerase sigma factor (sigma-70 family)
MVARRPGDMRLRVDADLDALYRAEAPRLVRMVRGKLRNPEESLELVQDAFVRFAAARPDGPLRRPEAFLQRIVRNLLINRSKRLAKRPMHIPITDEIEIAVPPAQATAIELKEMRDQYRAIVATLPPRTREVFLLHRVEELQYIEIAERLGISVRTVEWHIGQAIFRIGKALER